MDLESFRSCISHKLGSYTFSMPGNPTRPTPALPLKQEPWQESWVVLPQTSPWKLPLLYGASYPSIPSFWGPSHYCALCPPFNRHQASSPAVLFPEPRQGYLAVNLQREKGFIWLTVLDVPTQDQEVMLLWDCGNSAKWQWQGTHGRTNCLHCEAGRKKRHLDLSATIPQGHVPITYRPFP